MEQLVMMPLCQKLHTVSCWFNTHQNFV